MLFGQRVSVSGRDNQTSNVIHQLTSYSTDVVPWLNHRKVRYSLEITAALLLQP